jgi:sterol 3beta-glucosyltransferase
MLWPFRGKHPGEHMKVGLIAFGYRGDVQPALALAQHLMAAGHEPLVIASANFDALARDHGVPLAGVNIDTFRLAQTGTAVAQKHVAGHNLVRGLAADHVFEAVWEACQDVDVLLANIVTGFAQALPVARKRDIPLLGTSVYPAYPNSQIPNPGAPGGPTLPIINRLTYTLIDRYLWRVFGPALNRFCRRVSLPAITFADYVAALYDAPWLNAYSPRLLDRPPNWPDRQHVTGFWFVRDAGTWQPPPGLEAFLTAEPAPIAVTFSSVVDRNPAVLMEELVGALDRVDGRGVLLGGWSGIDTINRARVFTLDQAPHGWLFERVRAVVHHGGPGTVGATLRAGRPAVCVPDAFDQRYWGRILARRGVAPPPIPSRQLTAGRLATAIEQATTDRAMIDRARTLGAQIAAEDGPGNAIDLIVRYTSGVPA